MSRNLEKGLICPASGRSQPCKPNNGEEWVPKEESSSSTLRGWREEQSPEEGDDQTQHRNKVYISRQSDSCSSQGEDRKRQGQGKRVQG